MSSHASCHCWQKNNLPESHSIDKNPEMWHSQHECHDRTLNPTQVLYSTGWRRSNCNLDKWKALPLTRVYVGRGKAERQAKDLYLINSITQRPQKLCLIHKQTSNHGSGSLIMSSHENLHWANYDPKIKHTHHDRILASQRHNTARRNWRLKE